jgi:4-hydroxy-tetrahydrodipicolinate synthase
MSSTYVICMTPFDADDRFDEQALRGHLERLADSGIGVYLGGGGSGEGYTLRPNEVERVLAIGAEVLKGRVPVRAMGVEPRTAKEMVAFGKVVEKSGVDAMQLYSLDVGHGNIPRRSELDAYYTEVLESVPVPMILSTHYSVGYFIPIDLIDELLSRYEHLIAINCTTPDWGYLVRLLDAVGDRAEVHVGGPMQTLNAIALGATGYLSSEGNVAPRLCVSVCDLWDAGDLKGAADAYSKLMHLFTINMQYTAITGVKAALNLLGLPGGYPRRPRLPIDDEERERLRAALADLDIEELKGLR